MSIENNENKEAATTETTTPKAPKKSGSIKKSFQTGQFKSGAYSSVVTVLVIALVIVLNLVVGKLDLSTDLSKGNLFTLSKETKKILKNSRKDITFYYMVSSGSENEYIENVLKQYKKASKHISIKKVDPVANPAFASKYDITDDVSSNDVIVAVDADKTAKLVSGSEMYYSEQDYSGSYSSSSNSNYYLDAEGQLTSAIQNVLSGSTTKMYVATGHSEVALPDTLTKAFAKMNVETADLELLTAEKIPDDCNILMINGPTSDLADNEKKIVLDYLKAGGNAIINLSYTTEKMTNLEEVLEYYGIQSKQGIICETSGKYYYYPNFIVPELGTDASEMENGDVAGPFYAGISATEKLDNDKETKIVAYASASTFDEKYASSGQLENTSLLKSAVNSMLTTKEDKVAIDAKSLGVSSVSLTPVMQLVWAAVLIILLPLACLLCGFVIWMMRRKK